MMQSMVRVLRPAIFLLIALALLPAFNAAAPMPVEAQGGERVSRPGEYSGYSEPIYDDWVRTSQYITARDGTRLAADIFRPAVDDQPVEDPLPLVWTHTRYHRANTGPGGRVYSIVDFDPGMQLALRHGYIVALVDTRGSGASFGTRTGEFSREEAFDAYDVTEWFAAQPWCDGQIGMVGRSYLGITQYMAASTQPPHLRAIMPEMAMFDLYEFAYPGGIYRADFIDSWGELTRWLDASQSVAPVDEDADGVLLEAALAEHRDNRDIQEIAPRLPYRDSVDAATGRVLLQEWSPSSYLDAINESGVAVYHVAGWFDLWPRDALTWFANLTVPQRIVIGPWEHGGSEDFDLSVERLRWFDYWLKGIDNGIMDDPPVYYNVMGASGEDRWRSADAWPLPESQPVTYYLAAGPSGVADSANDGLLALDAPADAAAWDEFTVDYRATTGRGSRWAAGYGGDFDYPDMGENDARGLTYTTPPLAEDVIVTGHPVAHLWVTSSAEDGDFFVYLEEVGGGPVISEYVTEGALRASHRALADPPFVYFGLPYHPSAEADLAPLPAGEPVELVIDLHPASNLFDAGNSIRITVTGADRDNYQTPELDPAPVVQLYRDADHASFVVLPVVARE